MLKGSLTNATYLLQKCPRHGLLRYLHYTPLIAESLERTGLRPVHSGSGAGGSTKVRRPRRRLRNFNTTTPSIISYWELWSLLATVLTLLLSTFGLVLSLIMAEGGEPGRHTFVPAWDGNPAF